MEADERPFAEFEVADSKIGDLLCPSAGVVEEQEQGSVSQGEPSAALQAAEQGLDLVAFQEAGLGRCGPFHRDGGHPLAHGERLGFTGGDVVEQRVHGGQTLVAGSDVVVALVLQVAQEAHDPVEGQVVDGQLGDLGLVVVGHEPQQEHDRVPVAAHRRRPQALHGDEVVDEERLDQRPDGLSGAHGVASDHTGWA